MANVQAGEPAQARTLRPASTGRVSLSLLARACRLPFIIACVLPYIAGASFPGRAFDALRFALGLVAVAAGHLSANLVNDYADSRSGADWRDDRHFGFFGGSKVIQHGLMKEAAFLKLAVIAGAVSLASCIVLSVVAGDVFPVAGAAIVLLWAWAYSCKPFKLAYRRMGEATILVLFGPVTVLAGVYCRQGLEMWRLAVWPGLVCGLMTAGILVANEVPDYATDAQAGKRNLVGVLGPKAGWRAYLLIVLPAMAALVFAVARGLMGQLGLLGLAAAIPAAWAGWILKRRWDDPPGLVASARLTILAQALAAVGCIAGAMS